jgi:hypothetical protein
VGDLATGNLTIASAQNLFNKLRDMINASVVKARLYDSAGNMVKEFTDLQNIMVGVDGDYVFLYVRIVDMSADKYKFKTMHLIATEGTTQFIAVIHPFLKEYEKTENVIVDIKVRTGILGCVSG